LPAAAADLPLVPADTGLNTGTPALRSSNSTADILPADVAFRLQVIPQADSSLMLMWEMPERFYLYRKSLQVETADGRVLELELPAATPITDEFFGETEVYFDRLLARIPAQRLQAAKGAKLELLLGYQGCAQDLYCYPPQQKAVNLTLPD
jgi:thiol:disulfide interchange protein DsbD